MQETETIDEQYQRFLNDDIRVGDCIKSRTMGLAVGFVIGDGFLNEIPYWVIRNVHGKRDVIEKSDSVMLGFGGDE
jgi:hypothetical protein